MLRLLLIYAVFWVAPAAASDTPKSIGLLPSVAFGLGTATDELSAEWGTGFAYSVPLRLELHPNVSARVERR